MFELCRKIVAGPKKLLQWNGKQLDLTYVTDRIIAMAFPASGLQKAYRNSIKDVANYLHQKHGQNYLVINVSSRKYDYKFFNSNVLQYQWRDHLSPPLSTLFQISRNMYQFLKNNKHGVVAVHCNHGKGRTGTTIISFIMFTGFYQNYQQALAFYNKRRFVSTTYGVSQPCQKRYLKYYQNLKVSEKINPKLITYKLKRIRQKRLDKDKYYLQISSTRNLEPKYRQVFFNEQKHKMYPNVPLIGDICIQIFYDKWTGQQQVAMINCNTYFINENQGLPIMQDEMKILPQNSMFSAISEKSKFKVFNGDHIKVNRKHSTDFQISIQFQPYCQCHIIEKALADCPCQAQRMIQQKNWRKTIQNVEVAQTISKLQSCSLLFEVEYLTKKYLQQSELKLQEQQLKEHLHQQIVASQLKQIKQNSNNNSTSPQQKVQKSMCMSSLLSCQVEILGKPKSFSGRSQDPFNRKQSQHLQQQGDFQKGQFDYDLVVCSRNSV